MTEEQIKLSRLIIEEIVKKYKTARQFAAVIGVDMVDLHKWRKGTLRVSAKGVVSLCRLFPEVKPFQLNPDFFPEDLRFTFEPKESPKK